MVFVAYKQLRQRMSIDYRRLQDGTAWWEQNINKQMHLMKRNLWLPLISYMEVSASGCHPQEVFQFIEIQGQGSYGLTKCLKFGA